MVSLLKKMSESVVKYAEVLAQVLKVDVEIVDNQLFRVAGTGRYNDQKDLKNTGEAHVTGQVIRDGVLKIMEHPREDLLCRGCPRIENCIEQFEICMPILLDDTVIGVIALVCFDDEQRQHILNNRETFIQFIKQIADLIAAKAGELVEIENNLQVKELFNNVLNNIDKGVMVLDKNGKLCRCNKTACKILKMSQNECIECRVKLSKLDQSYYDYSTYNLTIKEKQHKFYGQDYDVSIGHYKRIFVFDDPSVVEQRLLAFAQAQDSYVQEAIIGHSKSILQLKSTVKKIASSTSTVTILGESGTGKELFARALHEMSSRHLEPFVAINCAAIPESLLESELFGYVKGAFSGANTSGKIGKIEAANNGTLFLDEIGDMPLHLQSKLLRVLEQKEVTRLGATRPVQINCRIVVATNKNLEEMSSKGLFREDLYYRLNVIPLVIPSLRERHEDIRLLTLNFIHKFLEILNKDLIKITDAFWQSVETYNWPGNVRELQNTVEYVVNMMDETGVISNDLLPEKIRNGIQKIDFDNWNLEYVEKQVIKNALDRYGRDKESKEAIALKLGIGIATLYRKIKKYDL